MTRDKKEKQGLPVVVKQLAQPQFPVTCSAGDPAAFNTEGTNSLYSCCGPLADFTGFFPRVVAFANASCLSPFPLLTGAQEPHWQPAQASAAATVQDARLNLCG